MKKQSCNEIIGLTTLCIYTLYKLYRKYFTEIGKKCGKSKNPNLCYLQVKIQGIKKQISYLKNNLGKCIEDKKPNNCKEKIENKINFLNKKLSKNISKKMRYLKK